MATKIRVLLVARPLARVVILDEVKEAGVSFNLSTQNVVILAILSVFAQPDLERSRCSERFKFTGDKL